MIHYHGSPITPVSAAIDVLSGRHAMISFANPEQLEMALEVCQSISADNGAFPAWKSGKPISDWTAFYKWVESFQYHPSFDWAIVPDVIDGSESDNDLLIKEWPFPKHTGVPVWHLHESLGKLKRLSECWPRIAIGSSGEFAQIGTHRWWKRMGQCFAEICTSDGMPICKVHGLRMLNPDVFSRFPFSSADSTNVARNIGIDSKWKGTYQPPNKATRAIVMARRIESVNSASRWDMANMAVANTEQYSLASLFASDEEAA